MVVMVGEGVQEDGRVHRKYKKPSVSCFVYFANMEHNYQIFNVNRIGDQMHVLIVRKVSF